MNQPLEFNPILYNEPISFVEESWNRRLSEHERNLAIMVFRWTRTNIEAEEIKLIDDMRCKDGTP